MAAGAEPLLVSAVQAKPKKAKKKAALSDSEEDSAEDSSVSEGEWAPKVDCASPCLVCWLFLKLGVAATLHRAVCMLASLHGLQDAEVPLPTSLECKGGAGCETWR